MAIAGNKAGRVGQSRYWTFFGIYIVAVTLLLIGGCLAVLEGSYGPGLVMIVAIAPVGIYWRVIMARRCRDIGWPAFAPWVIPAVQFALSSSLRLNYGAVGGAGGSAFLLVVLVALADLVFAIVIGCIGTKQAVDYAAVFGDGPGTLPRTQPRESVPLQGGTDRFDEAIARALEARRRNEAARGATQPSPPATAHPLRRNAGFGRRAV
jgi:uncharacterized membrane protein YhaH (DUF805 family)